MAPLQTRAAVAVDDGELAPSPSPGPHGAPIDYSRLGGFTLICEVCETLGEDFCRWGRRPYRLAGGARPMALDAEFLEPVARLHAWRPGHTLLVAGALAGLAWALAAHWCLRRRLRDHRGRRRRRQEQHQHQHQQDQRRRETTAAAAVALSLDRPRHFKLDGAGTVAPYEGLRGPESGP